jgi:hypothetical protein
LTALYRNRGRVEKIANMDYEKITKLEIVGNYYMFRAEKRIGKSSE